MRKERDVKSKNEISNILEEKNKEIFKFLTKINSTIAEIRKIGQKKYSILSLIFNCFYENRSLSLPKQSIIDYIHQDIIKNKGKMIVSFVTNGTNNMEIINENNYMKKIYNILVKNKCLEQGSNNYISIDIDFTQTHKSLIYRNLFGKDDPEKLKIKKLKRPKVKNKGENKEILKKEKSKKEKNDDDDFEIEILESVQDDTDNTELKKNNLQSIENKKAKNNNNIIGTNKNDNSNSNNFTDMNNIKNTNISKKNSNTLYLNRKRKMEKDYKIIKLEGERKNDKVKNSEFQADLNEKLQNNNNSNIIGEEKDKNNDKIVAEKEIMSLIDECKLFLSSFQDKNLMDNLEKEKNNFDEFDSFIIPILLKYRNENDLTIYLNLLNEKYSEFQKSIKNLIDYKSSLDGSNSNKFMAKFSVINKIILEKEKCCLLIDQIVTKLKQIFLEYNYIKKLLNNINPKKNEFFQKIIEIMSNINQYQEKENYVTELKRQLQEELKKILVIDKEENEKDN